MSKTVSFEVSKMEWSVVSWLGIMCWFMNWGGGVGERHLGPLQRNIKINSKLIKRNLINKCWFLKKYQMIIYKNMPFKMWLAWKHQISWTTKCLCYQIVARKKKLGKVTTVWWLLLWCEVSMGKFCPPRLNNGLICMYCESIYNFICNDLMSRRNSLPLRWQMTVL